MEPEGVRVGCDGKRRGYLGCEGGGLCLQSYIFPFLVPSTVSHLQGVDPGHVKSFDHKNIYI